MINSSELLPVSDGLVKLVEHVIVTLGLQTDRDTAMPEIAIDLYTACKVRYHDFQPGLSTVHRDRTKL